MKRLVLFYVYVKFNKVYNISILLFLDVYCCHEHFYIVVLGCLVRS